MSVVRTEVTLKNAIDVGKELEGLIKNEVIGAHGDQPVHSVK
jgi:hypothetical protein